MNLSNKIGELEKEILDLKSKSMSSSKKKSRSKQACLNLLNINFLETLIILKRIDANLKRKKYLRSRTKNLPNGEVKDPKISKFIFESFRLNGDLKVDIKSLYIWVHHIKSIFHKCKININTTELRRISYLRNNFITHITNSPLFKKSGNTHMGIKLDRGCESPQILFHDFLGKNKFVGFKKFIKQVESYIPELKNETNFYEQIYILYEHLDKLSETGLKRKAEGFINNIGVATEPPLKIANVLLKSLKDYRKLKGV